MTRILQHRFSPASQATRGFTLVEVTVALALIGLIAVALVVSLQFGRRSYQQILREDGAAWDVFSTQRTIRRLIESAYPLDDPALSEQGIAGDTQLLRILAPASLPRQDGLVRYRVEVRPQAGHLDMLIEWATQLDSAAPSAHFEEVLLERVASVRWDYCCSLVAGGANDARWQGSWSERSLPRLVRLRVAFPRGDRRSWPDLIVAPRLSEDANCVFDVVAQRCRSTQ